MGTPRRRCIVESLRCGECGFVGPANAPHAFEVDGGSLSPGSASYRVSTSPVETVDWRRFRHLRCRCRLESELKEASSRIDALDAFARHAGGILENMYVSYSLTPEKDELKKLVDRYHELFPSTNGGLEF